MTTEPDCCLIAEHITPTLLQRTWRSHALTAPEAATEPPHPHAPPAAPRRTGGGLKLRIFGTP